MAICDRCRNKSLPYWDDYLGRVVWCFARRAYLSPDPLIPYEVDKALTDNKCEFFILGESCEIVTEQPEIYL